MIENVYINGYNAFESFGITLPPSAVDAILLPPTNKSFVTNNSRMTDGEETIIALPKVAPRDVTIEMCVVGKENITEVNKLISSNVFNIILGRDMLTEYHFILVNCTQFNQIGNISKYVVKLRETNPKDRAVRR